MTAAPPALRLLIADDHDLAREGLRALLERALGERPGGCEVVAEAASAAEAVRLAATCRPDVALLDVRFAPGAMDGLEAARQIAAAAPAVRVVMLTLHDDPAYVRAALAAGARGFVIKDATRAALLAAIDQVLAGGLAVPPGLVQRAVAPAPHAGPADRASAAALARLTAREREVLDGLAEGRTNKEIAQALGITAGTVKAHVERLIGKLGVRDRTQAAVFAVAARR